MFKTNYYKTNKNELNRRRISNEIQSNMISEYNRNKGEASEDTIERKGIHNNIIKLINQGKNKEEILQFLNNNYPDSKIQNYFEKFITYHLEKHFSKPIEDDGSR